MIARMLIPTGEMTFSNGIPVPKQLFFSDENKNNDRKLYLAGILKETDFAKLSKKYRLTSIFPNSNYIAFRGILAFLTVPLISDKLVYEEIPREAAGELKGVGIELVR